MPLQRGARIIAFLLDVLVTLLGALSAWIIATGGSVIFVRGQRISLTGADDPSPWTHPPPRHPVRDVAIDPVAGGFPAGLFLPPRPAHTTSSCERVPASPALTEQGAGRLVVSGLVSATVVKLLLAWANPGFFSGDDVEVQEMSLRLLWRTDWPIWDLRSPFFPVGLIYPGQKLVAASGIATSAAALIFTGRAAVAVLSSMAIWLVWRIGRRLWPETPGWAMVAALLFATAKLHIAFGSSELPRPVATVAVLGAFLLLQDPRAGRVLASASLIGVAMCFRFSEVVFLGPAVVSLAWQRRWLPVIAVVGIAGAAALAIIGASDAWYWGEPFHSLRAAIDYTLVEKLSSRGYQSAGWLSVARRGMDQSGRWPAGAPRDDPGAARHRSLGVAAPADLERPASQRGAIRHTDCAVCLGDRDPRADSGRDAPSSKCGRGLAARRAARAARRRTRAGHWPLAPSPIECRRRVRDSRERDAAN